MIERTKHATPGSRDRWFEDETAKAAAILALCADRPIKRITCSADIGTIQRVNIPHRQKVVDVSEDAPAPITYIIAHRPQRAVPGADTRRKIIAVTAHFSAATDIARAVGLSAVQTRTHLKILVENRALQSKLYRRRGSDYVRYFLPEVTPPEDTYQAQPRHRKVGLRVLAAITAGANTTSALTIAMGVNRNTLKAGTQYLLVHGYITSTHVRGSRKSGHYVLTGKQP